MKLNIIPLVLTLGVMFVGVQVANATDPAPPPTPVEHTVAAFGSTTYTGVILAHRVNGQGSVTQFSMDTDADGMSDKVATTSTPNTLASSFSNWEMNMTEVQWEDEDDDCKLDGTETIGPEL